MEDKIRLKSQVLEAIEFYRGNPTVPLSAQKDAFESAVGVHIKYSQEDYENYTKNFI